MEKRQKTLPRSSTLPAGGDYREKKDLVDILLSKGIWVMLSRMLKYSQ